MDDDPIILLDACAIIEEAGFRPLEASNVAEALSVLEERGDEITLLFTDVQMPGGRDGFELAREACERWPNLKVLIASGAATPRSGDMPDNAVFVAKPFSAGVIHTRLQELLPDGEKPEPLKKAAAERAAAKMPVSPSYSGMTENCGGHLSAPIGGSD